MKSSIIKGAINIRHDAGIDDELLVAIIMEYGSTPYVGML